MSEKFDPSKHLRPMRGGAEYLDVKWRLVWLRQDHPDAEIETRALEHEPGKWAAFVARVALPGKGSATGHGSETAADFRDYYEKAETKALGRALAALGYGTQFVGDELDEGERIVDSPVERPKPAPRQQEERPRPAAPPRAAISAPQHANGREEPTGPDDLNPHPPGGVEHVLFEARRLAQAGHTVPEVWSFLTSRQAALGGDWQAVLGEWKHIKASIEARRQPAGVAG